MSILTRIRVKLPHFCPDELVFLVIFPLRFVYRCTEGVLLGVLWCTKRGKVYSSVPKSIRALDASRCFKQPDKSEFIIV